MTDRIAADRWTLDQFVSKAREIRRRLLRWHETLPGSVGLDIEHQGQRVRVVRWDEHTAIGRETFRSRLKAGHGNPLFVLENPYAPGLDGPIERDGQFSSDQTEYVLRDFWEHLAGDPTLEILLAAFGVILDSQVFSAQPLGVPEGQTIGLEDVEVGVTPWIVKGTKIDRQILDEFVEAAEKLAAGPRDQAGRGRKRPESRRPAAQRQHRPGSRRPAGRKRGRRQPPGGPRLSATLRQLGKSRARRNWQQR